MPYRAGVLMPLSASARSMAAPVNTSRVAAQCIECFWKMLRASLQTVGEWDRMGNRHTCLQALADKLVQSQARLGQVREETGHMGDEDVQVGREVKRAEAAAKARARGIPHPGLQKGLDLVAITAIKMRTMAFRV